MKNLIACVIGGAVAAGGAGGAGVALDPSMSFAHLDNPAGVRLLHGVARPGRDVTLSFYLDGTVASLSAEGRVVRSGEVLASLDARVAVASLRIAEIEAGMTGDVDEARARHRQAERSHARLLASARGDAAHPAEIEASEAAVEQAAAVLAQAAARHAARVATVELRRATVDEHTMEAPFDGLILRVDSEGGLAVSEATPLIRLVDLSTLKVDLHLPVALYGALQRGDEYPLDLGLPIGSLVDAELVWAEPMVDPATSTFRAVFEIDNADGAIPAGVTARLEAGVVAALLSGDEPEAVLVDAGAAIDD